MTHPIERLGPGWVPRAIARQTIVEREARRRAAVLTGYREITRRGIGGRA